MPLRKIGQKRLSAIPDVIDVDNGLPLPGIDWELRVNRAEAARYGASPGAVGAVVQMVTTGLKLSDYPPGRQR
jgi:multidrug efflux pump